MAARRTLPILVATANGHRLACVIWDADERVGADDDDQLIECAAVRSDAVRRVGSSRIGASAADSATKAMFGLGRRAPRRRVVTLSGKELYQTL